MYIFLPIHQMTEIVFTTQRRDYEQPDNEDMRLVVADDGRFLQFINVFKNLHHVYFQDKLIATVEMSD